MMSAFYNTYGDFHLLDRHIMKPVSLLVLITVLDCQPIGLVEVVEILNLNLR